MFAVALVSGILLEKSEKSGYDFEQNPVLYTNHKISIDRRLLSKACSSEDLTILVRDPIPLAIKETRNKSIAKQEAYHCFGLLNDTEVLFRAILQTATLDPSQRVQTQRRAA